MNEASLERRLLQARSKGSGTGTCRRVVLVEPSPAERKTLASRIRRSGLEVSSFGDAYVAFLYLLAGLDEVDVVLLNDDEPRSSGFLARLEALSRYIVVGTYSGRDPERSLELSIAGSADAHEAPHDGRSTAAS